MYSYTFQPKDSNSKEKNSLSTFYPQGHHQCVGNYFIFKSRNMEDASVCFKVITQFDFILRYLNKGRRAQEKNRKKHLHIQLLLFK